MKDDAAPTFWQAAGGSVQMVLGNHESMVLRGDLRYLSPKYLEVAKLLQRTVPELYGKDTALGRWLHTRATVLKLGETLFVHLAIFGLEARRVD